MRVAFFTGSGPGHAYPMTTLARRLKGRGHDVVLIGFPSAEPLVRAAELPFVPIGEKEDPTGSDREILNQLSKLQGQESLEFTHRAVADALQASFDHLPRALRETGVDALVIDGVLIELGLVSMHLGIRHVHVSNSLHYDFSCHTPLFTFDWPHETTPEALARNKEGLPTSLKPSARGQLMISAEH